ncbi:hypothetical protein DFP72DRAFT_908821 [Ephemerocybe angulata]|uniref:Uncharacterized protein n=1 Tax=Ephemerocybe angulata TaxID=980116 RepID=A0A8H6M488_9AGAR|nr:hypothetical protein DFP72DRAFT_908821 [Tulosesus angulatus]
MVPGVGLVRLTILALLPHLDRPLHSSARYMSRMVPPTAFAARSPLTRHFAGLLCEAGPVGVSGSWGTVGGMCTAW